MKAAMPITSKAVPANADAAAAQRAKNPTIPAVIVNSQSRISYNCGKFLGKGGFAFCYEVTSSDASDCRTLACKIVSKKLLVKDSQKEKMIQEIEIHRKLSHEHLVKFYDSFADQENMYILLELCSRRSLMELHRRRKLVTVPEAQYFMRQIVSGCQYLHSNKIIHRDLKLGNVFLNSKLWVKIGDFGLATQVNRDGEQKKTMCGTPNYLAPEVLNKQGHSFEVDVWSLGCILYTLVVGRPPFESPSLKETYVRIKNNNFKIPSSLNPVVAAFIRSMLQSQPQLRPSVFAMPHDPFFSLQPILPSLPESVLTVTPRLDDPARQALRNIRNTSAIAAEDEEMRPQEQQEKKDQVRPTNAAGKAGLSEAASNNPPAVVLQPRENSNGQLLPSRQTDKVNQQMLFEQLATLLASPTAQAGPNIQYYKRDNRELFFNKNEAPPAELQKKMLLLEYFRTYMMEHLLTTGQDMAPKESDKFARLPVLSAWFRTKHAMLNFFKDHTKIILCPNMEAVSYIDEKRVFTTYRFRLLAIHGMTAALTERLNFAKEMLDRMLRAELCGNGRVKAPDALIPTTK
uniref:Serine/threonine-protein kinase PLK n=1 Tax=Macrostomum lignano TaxID=282301 RepID=A0A1I8H547_9PLAT